MATPVLVCGFECRSLQAHWVESGGGTHTLQATYARNGGTALRLQNTATGGRVIYLVDGFQYLVARFYIRFQSLPGADVLGIIHIRTNGGGYHYYLGFTQSTGKLCLGPSGAQIAGPAIVAGRWYRVDLKVNPVGATHYLDWQVDGVAQTQVSAAAAAGTVYAIALGAEDVGTYDVAYDDVTFSTTDTDYPLGPATIRGYALNATSGTHNQTAGDLQDESSTNVTSGDSSGAKANETTPDTTTYVKQVIARNTTYWEGVYATADQTVAPSAVAQVVATRAVTAGANDQKAQLYDGTSAADAYALTSTPNATLTWFRKTWAAAPSTGAWTLAKLQAARIRWGFGSVNTATYPPAISFTMLEAEFAGAAPPAWTTPLDTVAMGTTPELQFDSPSVSNSQHFYLELDTANTFDTGALRTYRSDESQTNWAYWDGDTWEALPAGGLDPLYAGNEIRYTITTPLASGTWYRRVRASV